MDQRPDPTYSSTTVTATITTTTNRPKMATATKKIKHPMAADMVYLTMQIHLDFHLKIVSSKQQLVKQKGQSQVEEGKEKDMLEMEIWYCVMNMRTMSMATTSFYQGQITLTYHQHC